MCKRELKNDDIRIAEVINILSGFDLNLMSYGLPTPQRFLGTVVPHHMEPLPADIVTSVPTPEHVKFVQSMKPPVLRIPVGVFLLPDDVGAAVAQQVVPVQHLPVVPVGSVPGLAFAPQPVHPVVPLPAATLRFATACGRSCDATCAGSSTCRRLAEYTPVAKNPANIEVRVPSSNFDVPSTWFEDGKIEFEGPSRFVS